MRFNFSRSILLASVATLVFTTTSAIASNGTGITPTEENGGIASVNVTPTERDNGTAFFAACGLNPFTGKIISDSKIKGPMAETLRTWMPQLDLERFYDANNPASSIYSLLLTLTPDVITERASAIIQHLLPRLTLLPRTDAHYPSNIIYNAFKGTGDLKEQLNTAERIHNVIFFPLNDKNLHYKTLAILYSQAPLWNLDCVNHATISNALNLFSKITDDSIYPANATAEEIAQITAYLFSCQSLEHAAAMVSNGGALFINTPNAGLRSLVIELLTYYKADIDTINSIVNHAWFFALPAFNTLTSHAGMSYHDLIPYFVNGAIPIYASEDPALPPQSGPISRAFFTNSVFGKITKNQTTPEDRLRLFAQFAATSKAQ